MVNFMIICQVFVNDRKSRAGYGFFYTKLATKFLNKRGFTCAHFAVEKEYF